MSTRVGSPVEVASRSDLRFKMSRGAPSTPVLVPSLSGGNIPPVDAPLLSPYGRERGNSMGNFAAPTEIRCLLFNQRQVGALDRREIGWCRESGRGWLSGARAD